MILSSKENYIFMMQVVNYKLELNLGTTNEDDVNLNI
jgi:hypothetical protein